MFTTYPETQSMFPQFAQVAVSQLSNNLQFLAATYSVFSGMNFIVSNVDDSESITKLISKMDSPIFFVPKPSVAPSFEVSFSFGYYFFPMVIHIRSYEIGDQPNRSGSIEGRTGFQVHQ